MTFAELRQTASARGIDTRGNRVAVTRRLVEADAAEAAARIEHGPEESTGRLVAGSEGVGREAVRTTNARDAGEAISEPARGVQAPARKARRGEFSKADIERRLIQAAEERGAFEGVEISDAQADAMGVSEDTFSTSFRGEFPPEVRDWLEGQPANVRTKFKKNRPNGRGQDLLEAMGEDAYFSRVLGLTQARIGRAKEIASGDPVLEFLSFVHDELPRRQRDRVAFEVIDDPANLPDGTKLKVAGREFEIVVDDDGVSFLVEQVESQQIPLGDGDFIESAGNPKSFPLSALDALPVDVSPTARDAEPTKGPEFVAKGPELNAKGPELVATMVGNDVDSIRAPKGSDPARIESDPNSPAIPDSSTAPRPPETLAQRAQRNIDLPRVSADYKPLPKATERAGIIAPTYFQAARLLAPDMGRRVAETMSAVTGRIRGHSLPRLVKANAEAGEAGVRLASSNVAAKAVAQELIAKTVGKVKPDSQLSRKIGAVIVEDQLRQTRRDFLAAGDTAGAANVRTLVDPTGYFTDEASYQAALRDPEVVKVLDAVKSEIMPVVSDLYHRAGGTTTRAPSADTGVFMSLKSVRPDEQIPRGSSAFAFGPAQPTKSSTPTAMKRRTTPMARRRTGASEKYDIDFVRLVENSIQKQLSIANMRDFQEALIASGDAVLASPAKAPKEIKGEPVARANVDDWRLILAKEDEAGHTDTTTVSQVRNLYVRRSLMDEVEAAAGIGIGGKGGIAQRLANEAAAAQIVVGLSDNIAHTARTFAQLMVNPSVGRNKLSRAAGKLGGLPRLVAASDAVIAKAVSVAQRSPAAMTQLRELAEIGAARDFAVAGDTRPPSSVTGRVVDTVTAGWWERLLSAPIRVIDVAGRLALDDAWKVLRDAGLTPDTVQSRREFVNQMGQYNLRLQGTATRALRTSGISPFVTGGVTGIRSGIRAATAAPRALPKSAKASAILRATNAAAIAGTAVQIGLVNMLMWGEFFPDGIPPGAVKIGEDDEGRPRYIDMLDLFTGIRRGMRATGLREPVEAIVEERDVDYDRTFTDIVNTLSRPVVGPGMQTAAIAASGHELSLQRLGQPRRVSNVAPPGEMHGLEQAGENIKAAAAYLGGQVVPKPGGEEGNVEKIIRQNIGPFAPRTGKNSLVEDERAERVKRAQLYDYMDDLVRRAKREKKPEERAIWIIEQVKANVQEPELVARAVQELRRRRKTLVAK